MAESSPNVFFPQLRWYKTKVAPLRRKAAAKSPTLMHSSCWQIFIALTESPTCASGVAELQSFGGMVSKGPFFRSIDNSTANRTADTLHRAGAFDPKHVAGASWQDSSNSGKTHHP